MSEYQPEITPLEYLERNRGELTIRSLIVDEAGCHCGGCMTKIEQVAIPERCPKTGCNVFWTRAILAKSDTKIPPTCHLTTLTAYNVLVANPVHSERTLRSTRLQVGGRAIMNVIPKGEYL